LQAEPFESPQAHALGLLMLLLQKKLPHCVWQFFVLVSPRGFEPLYSP
jgi:hypothetical protein